MKKFEELGISPAPWKVEPNHYGIRVTDWFGNVVCDDFADDREAHMCAAAPELHDFLREAIEDKCHFCTATEDERRELCDQCIVADWKEALAKAAGEREE